MQVRGAGVLAALDCTNSAQHLEDAPAPLLCPQFAHSRSREEVTMPKKGHARSAITGRYVKMTTAARNPRTTVVHKPKKK